MRKAASLALSVLGVLSFLASARGEEIVDAVTAPSQRLELAMPQLGVVREAAVVEGDRVSKGQLLLQQDDAAEQARLRGLKLRADVAIAVRARETDLALKRIIYERKRRLFEQVARHVAADRELRKEDEVGARARRRGADPLQVSRKVADGRVDLRERETHESVNGTRRGSGAAGRTATPRVEEPGANASKTRRHRDDRLRRGLRMALSGEDAPEKTRLARGSGALG